MTVLVEACVDAIDAALEAEQGGADRIELCGELLQGGVTPSGGLIGAVRDRLRIPVFVLIRPRAGDFLYTPSEIDVMRRDILLARSLGANGVVLGALDANGGVDVHFMRELIAVARPMAVTFHRAFDFADDQDAALAALCDLGVDRVLTSGGAASALEGATTLARLVQRALGAPIILAGGSISADNVGDVVRTSGVSEVHVRGAEDVESRMHYRRPSVTLARPHQRGDYARSVTQSHVIQDIVAAAQRD